MKKVSSLALFAAFVLAFPVQEPGVQLPKKELDQLNFMVGSWKGDLTMYSMGSELAIKANMDCKWKIGNRYLMSDHTYNMPPIGEIPGMQWLTYDPDAKVYRMYWIDAMSSEMLDFKGVMKDGVLDVYTEEKEVPGLGKSGFRAVYKMLDNGKLDFQLSYKNQDKWSPLIKGTYTK